jgi:hypothetical protein
MHDQSKHAAASLARMVERLVVLHVVGLARRQRHVIHRELDGSDRERVDAVIESLRTTGVVPSRRPRSSGPQRAHG